MIFLVMMNQSCVKLVIELCKLIFKVTQLNGYLFLTIISDRLAKVA